MKNVDVKKEKRIESIKTICIVLLSLILFVYLTIGINSIMHGGKMGFFSLRFYIVSSDSYETNNSTGDSVVARSIKMTKIKENDNIIYKRNNTMAIKKVIKTENDNGKVNFVVENDRLLSNEKIENAEVMGKVLFTIKGAGNIALFIQSPLGTLNLILIALCIFIIIKKIINGNQEDSDKEDIIQKGNDGEEKEKAVTGEEENSKAIKQMPEEKMINNNKDV